MTDEERQALRDFSDSVKMFAFMTQWHLKRDLPDNAYAKNEIAGYYDALNDANERLIRTLLEPYFNYRGVEINGSLHSNHISD